MRLEHDSVERKSLRQVTAKTADWDDIARACVAFANAQGGLLLVGFEDGERLPPVGQVVSPDLPDQLRKRIGELTVNVQVVASLQRAENGAEFVEVDVDRSSSIASTSDGRYFLRVVDSCEPVLGDDVRRLTDERAGRPWEVLDGRVPRNAADTDKLAHFAEGIRRSSRVKDSVKEKSPDELLDHYGLARGDTLTNLGVLLLAGSADRRGLGTAPLVQAIRFDEARQKVNKWVWDDGSLSPLELVDAIWQELPDFRESYEVAEGMFRRNVPVYDEAVVRELLINALVHRPYTQRGDLFLNLHPDRLEIVNPGRLPLGVTPRNILHASRRRNDGLARVFHDLGLMEREGSGFDLVYDRLLSQGRPAPVVEEGPDWVKVTIGRRTVKAGVLRLVTEADARLQLTQRERITLGVLAQGEGLTASELANALDTDPNSAVHAWLGRLQEFGLVRTSGKTKGTRYFVDPRLLRQSDVPLTTSLRRIEPHRLRALIREDVSRYPGSGRSEISARIGSEISLPQLRRALAHLVRSGDVVMEGQRKAAKYRLG